MSFASPNECVAARAASPAPPIRKVRRCSRMVLSRSRTSPPNPRLSYTRRRSVRIHIRLKTPSRLCEHNRGTSASRREPPLAGRRASVVAALPRNLSAAPLDRGAGRTDKEPGFCPRGLLQMRFEGTSGYVATDDLKVAVHPALPLQR